MMYSSNCEWIIPTAIWGGGPCTFIRGGAPIVLVGLCFRGVCPLLVDARLVSVLFFWRPFPQEKRSSGFGEPLYGFCCML